MEEIEKNNDIEAIPKKEQEKQLNFFATAGQFGIKGIKYFSLVLLLFGLLNIILFIIAVYTLNRLSSVPQIIFTILFFIIAIIFVAISLYFTYKYLMIDGLRTAYKFMSSFVKKVCNNIINTLSATATDKLNIDEKYINNMISKGNWLTGIYGKKIPSKARKTISFFLRRVPMASILIGLKDSIRGKSKQQASNLLFGKVSSYITDSILGTNDMKWIYWLLPLNVGVIAVLLYIIISFLA